VNDLIQSIIRPAAGGVAFGAGASAQTVAVDDPASFFSSGSWIPIVTGIAIALVVHVVKATARVAANATTGGLAAPVLSTAEDGASFILAASAIVIPVLAAILLVGLVVLAIMLLRRRARKRRGERHAGGGVHT
jgi:ABC-type proline/glycine betaine transport system permease subunit